MNSAADRASIRAVPAGLNRRPDAFPALPCRAFPCRRFAAGVRLLRTPAMYSAADRASIRAVPAGLNRRPDAFPALPCRAFPCRRFAAGVRLLRTPAMYPRTAFTHSKAHATKISSFSDAHGHDDVAVFVVVAFGGAELAGGLGGFQFEADLAGAGGFEEVDQGLGIEADRERGAGVGSVGGIFGLAGFGGRSGNLEFAFFQAQADGARTLVGELGYAEDCGI